ncbi:hypothetical protein [Alteromonas sp.]|jgi:hypothetical protein|uniref:hypothetical protein n=1 Tax=Alteromonas sp. TaxID=232 RepID=UPI000B733ECC|nr:hypothetical protein [Alteromonas sp.]MAI38568.1 hypothetical protein [Alteromonas sp.]OUX85843.1 MAG: hypothetical protein CBB95_13215 [Alteromonas sp. TMED35]|tara:strand:- start:49648 stop:49941 length:294 start_codon:yes stop_codon:yes gene_type:complete
MNNTINQLIIICQKMHEEGKTPSVGILRSKAPFKVSVTEAIDAIKRFNASTPRAQTKNSQHDTQLGDDSVSLATRVDALEREVETLKASLADLLRHR